MDTITTVFLIIGIALIFAGIFFMCVGAMLIDPRNPETTMIMFGTMLYRSGLFSMFLFGMFLTIDISGL